MDQLALTWFDWAVVAVMAVSALMGFARGLLRETSSLIAFAAATVAAYFSVKYGMGLLGEFIPSDWPEWAGPLVVGAVAFSIVYIIAALIGGAIAGFVHNTPAIGGLDRIFGLVFGVTRGAAVLVLAVFLMRLTVPQSALPSDITTAMSYPHLEAASHWLEGMVPDAKLRVEEALQRGATEALTPQ
jgi:membrane protein required for colicin V production